MNKMLIKGVLCLTSCCAGFSYEGGSVTGGDAIYRQMCIKAATDEAFFKCFRSTPEYAHALELSNGEPFAQYLQLQATPSIRSKMATFRRLDEIGSPAKAYYPKLGFFSGTTLRYACIADQICRRFQLPENAKIVEIGAGFGGQCFILSCLLPWSNYYIYDLIEPNFLINKVLRELKVDKVTCSAPSTPCNEEELDLCISNYAFSECDKGMQLDYLNRILAKSKRGYLLYNQISHLFSIDSLTPNEVISLLQEKGISAWIEDEPIPTFPGNVLILWDSTRTTQ